ncbi:hypothetical protein DPMN_165295 [Dreissena polymorpha]|uniref:Uncharacterized protein n=1 Tax=Dreissena polymorpha TaxID=45954 RepID=A0A9D4IUH1_DREPO|nr:hypothetical protein DPMN_165295 [Dreissena polymorpha]
MAAGRTLSMVIAAPRAVPEFSCRRAHAQTLNRRMAGKMRGRKISLPEVQSPGFHSRSVALDWSLSAHILLKSTAGTLKHISK